MSTYLVASEALVPASLAAVPARTFGPADDPAYFLLFLNLHEAGLTPDECDGFAWDLWMLVGTLGGAALTTRRPDLYPGAYGEVRYQRSLAFCDSEFPPNGVGGMSQAVWRNDPRDRWDRSCVFISHERTAPDRQARARIARHELMHAVAGWQHAPPPENNMGPEDGPRAVRMWAEGVRLCARNAARNR